MSTSPPTGTPEPVRPPVPTTPVRLLVGPANFAGQAWAWARAAEREVPGVGAVVMSVDRGGLAFDSDYPVPLALYGSGRWGAEQEEWVTAGFSHVLIDAMRPVLGPRYGDDCGGEIPVLERAGLAVALAAHGSDIRLPSRHAALYPGSPFASPPADRADYVRRLETQARAHLAILRDFSGPVFVSTPDLLDFAPGARLLPVVVDVERWTTDRPLLPGRPPVVLHVPSNPFLKGSHLIDPVMTALHERGVIEYRRVEGVPPEQMPGLVADADIVLDQFALGLYSAMAVQGLAAGRVVVADVPERVRDRVPGGSLPVLQATADELGAVVERIAADPDPVHELAAAGPAFARRVHDGRYSARVLAAGLGLPAPVDDPSLPAVPLAGAAS